MSQVKKGGLGRGLGALLKGVDVPTQVTQEKPAQQNPAQTNQGNKDQAKTDKSKTDQTTGKPAQDTGKTQNTAAPGVERAKDAAVVSPMNSSRNAGTAVAASSSQTGNAGEAISDGDLVVEIPVDEIKRGTYQPRQHFDDEALQELGDSIASQGLIQPVLVRKRAGAYELVAGERRWRASKLIGLKTIPAIVREMDDGSVAAVTLIENIQREDLNPLEEARALQRLRKEFAMTHQDVADAVGRSRAAVSNLIRLLDLDERVADMLANGKLEMGHARALLSLSANDQHLLAMKVYAEGLSVRATEKLVRGGDTKKAVKKESRKSDSKSGHIKTLEYDLADKLGSTVTISHGPTNKGAITITYNSLDELDGILAHIK